MRFLKVLLLGLPLFGCVSMKPLLEDDTRLDASLKIVSMNENPIEDPASPATFPTRSWTLLFNPDYAYLQENSPELYKRAINRGHKEITIEPIAARVAFKDDRMKLVSLDRSVDGLNLYTPNVDLIALFYRCHAKDLVSGKVLISNVNVTLLSARADMLYATGLYFDESECAIQPIYKNAQVTYYYRGNKFTYDTGRVFAKHTPSKLFQMFTGRTY